MCEWGLTCRRHSRTTRGRYDENAERGGKCGTPKDRGVETSEGGWLETAGDVETKTFVGVGTGVGLRSISSSKGKDGDGNDSNKSGSGFGGEV